MSDNDTAKLAPVHELPDILKDDFAEIYGLNSDIAALMEMHIKPLAKSRTRAIRMLKAKTGFSRQVLMAYFKLYSLEASTEDFESDNEGARLKDELKMCFDALKVGEVLDFLGPLEAVQGEKVVAQMPYKGKPAPEATNAPAGPVVRKDTNWNKPPAVAAAPGSAAELEQAFQAGEKAGLAGQDCKEALKTKGWHHASAPAKKFREGHIAGLNQRAKDLADKPKATQAPVVLKSEPTGNEGGYQFQDGKRAAASGMPVTANPYPPGSVSGASWNSGWISLTGNTSEDTLKATVGYTMSAGKHAAIEGKAKDANPHKPGSPSFDSWNSGWDLGAEQRATAQAMVNDLLEQPKDENGNVAPIADEAKAIDDELQAQQNALAAG